MEPKRTKRKPIGNQRSARRERKGAKGIPKGAKRESNGSKGEPKGSLCNLVESEPKGCQNETRGSNRVSNHVKNPPTLWSGVLERLESKGGGFLPPTPLRPGSLAEVSPKHQPV